MTLHLRHLKRIKIQRNQLLFSLILLFSIFMRFFHIRDRWLVFTDQSGFALVARYALAHLHLPLLGPFSSAGPFQTGGEWYWIIMAGYLLDYGWAFSPWLFISCLSVGFVALSMYAGKYFKGTSFAVIIGLLAAVSVGEVVQGTNLSNQTPLSWISLLLLLCMLRFVKKKDLLSLFLMGFVSSLGMSIHLQGSALFLLVLSTLIFTGIPSLKQMGVLIIGILLPWIPVFIIDVQRGFQNTKNMMYYLIFNPNKIPYEALGRRWKTFVIEFIPYSWARGVGGYSVIAAFSIIGVGFYAVKEFLEKKLPNEIRILLLSTLLMYILLRYTRTPLFESFYVFLHPVILFLVSWFIYEVYSTKRLIGVFLFLVFFMGGLFVSFYEIGRASSITQSVESKETELLLKTSNTKFSIYDYKSSQLHQSLTLSLFLDAKNKIDENGLKVGVIATTSAKLVGPTLVGTPGDTRYIDLSGFSHEELRKMHWQRMNPEDIYLRTQEWYKKPNI